MGFFRNRVKGKPLVDVLGLALNKETYDVLLEKLRKGRSISSLVPVANTALARNHRAKILREEVTRQFSHKYQGVVQLIANSIDAKPADHSGDYVVDVSLNGKSVTIRDRGEGLDLETIITTLLVPLRSGRDGKENIGRFGVGFFSSLEYCVSNPGMTRLSLSSSQGKQGYVASFGAKSGDVEDLYCHIGKKARLSRGTTVRIDFPHKKDELRDYIVKYLGFFDPRRARIRVNDKVINERFAGRVYRIGDSRVSFEESNKGSISLYSQGIFISSKDFPDYDVRIDLPPTLLLVEGRDEFKRDRNYQEAFKNIVHYVCRNSKRISEDNDLDVREFLVHLISATNLPSKNFTDIIEENKKHLFEEETYVIQDHDGLGSYVDAKDFFGDHIGSHLYVPKGMKSFLFWRSLLPNLDSLVRSRTRPSQTAYEEIIASPGLGMVKDELQKLNDRGSLHLVTHYRQQTRSPLIGDRDGLYINTRHPLLAQDGFLARYMMANYFGRAVHGEVESENRIIR